MLPTSRPSPFGSHTRTRILLALRLLESSFPRELSRLLDSPVFAVRQALAGLERDGLVSFHTVGRTRVCRIDPAYFAHHELDAYLWRLATADAGLCANVVALRPQAAVGLRVAPRPASPPPVPAPVASAPEAVRPAAAPDAPRPRPARQPRDGWKNW